MTFMTVATIGCAKVIDRLEGHFVDCEGGRLAVEEVPVPPRQFPLRLDALGRSPEWLLLEVRDGNAWTCIPPEDTLIAPGRR